VTTVLDGALEPELEDGGCPHVAVLLRTREELPSVQASFYALGAKRGAWCVHRSLTGQEDEDRAALIAAGLDVEKLEASGQFEIAEVIPGRTKPEDYPKRWLEGLEKALAAGRTGLWYSRYIVGPDEKAFEFVAPFEMYWDAAFKDRPVVQLCPFLVGDLDAAATLDRLGRVSAMHGEGVLVPDTQSGYRLLRPA
jgi:hypothetical protein